MRFGEHRPNLVKMVNRFIVGRFKKKNLQIKNWVNGKLEKQHKQKPYTVKFISSLPI